MDVAYEKAVRLGREQEQTYANAYGEPVRWDFVGLVDLEELPADTLEDGVEIKSRLFDTTNPQKLVCARENLKVFRWQREREERAR